MSDQQHVQRQLQFLQNHQDGCWLAMGTKNKEFYVRFGPTKSQAKARIGSTGAGMPKYSPVKSEGGTLTLYCPKAQFAALRTGLQKWLALDKKRRTIVWTEASWDMGGDDLEDDINDGAQDPDDSDDFLDDAAAVDESETDDMSDAADAETEAPAAVPPMPDLPAPVAARCAALGQNAAAEAADYARHLLAEGGIAEDQIAVHQANLTAFLESHVAGQGDEAEQQAAAEHLAYRALMGLRPSRAQAAARHKALPGSSRFFDVDLRRLSDAPVSEDEVFRDLMLDIQDLINRQPYRLNATLLDLSYVRQLAELVATQPGNLERLANTKAAIAKGFKDGKAARIFGIDPALAEQPAQIQSIDGLTALLHAETDRVEQSLSDYLALIARAADAGRLAEKGLAMTLSTTQIAAGVRRFVAPTLRALEAARRLAAQYPFAALTADDVIAPLQQARTAPTLARYDAALAQAGIAGAPLASALDRSMDAARKLLERTAA